MKSLCLSLQLLQLASASFSILQAYNVTLLFLRHLLVFLRPQNTQVHIKVFSPHKSPCFSNAYSWRFHYTECPLEGAFHFSKRPPKASWQIHNTLGNVPSKYTTKFSIRFYENNTHLKILEGCWNVLSWGAEKPSSLPSSVQSCAIDVDFLLKPHTCSVAKQQIHRRLTFSHQYLRRSLWLI